MPLSDNFGVTWAHSTTVKAGDKLKCDDGFTCLADGEIVEVCTYHGHMPNHDEDYLKLPIARLYIPCTEGEHFIDGQIGDDGELVGLYPVAP